MIDFTKPVQTKDGRSVRILCTDANSPYPIVGLVNGVSDSEGGCEYVLSWTRDGVISNVPGDDSVDLVNAPHRVKVKIIVYTNPDDGGDIVYWAYALVEGCPMPTWLNSMVIVATTPMEWIQE